MKPMSVNLLWNEKNLKAKQPNAYTRKSFCIQYIFLSIILFGCGVNKQEYHRTVVTLETTKRTLEQSQCEVAQSKTELAAASKKIDDLSLQIKKL